MTRPLHAIIVSCLIRNDREEVLLIRHPRRGWELPQGHVEAGEDLLTAARREVQEETGYRVSIDRLTAVFSKLDPAPSAVIFGFTGRLEGGNRVLSDESLDVRWFSAEEARDLPEHPVNKTRLATLLDSATSLIYQAYSMSPHQINLSRELV